MFAAAAESGFGYNMVMLLVNLGVALGRLQAIGAALQKKGRLMRVAPVRYFKKATFRYFAAVVAGSAGVTYVKGV